jgi:hypothetical protein
MAEQLNVQHQDGPATVMQLSVDLKTCCDLISAIGFRFCNNVMYTSGARTCKLTACALYKTLMNAYLLLIHPSECFKAPYF